VKSKAINDDKSKPIMALSGDAKVKFVTARGTPTR
jgi:hypothetical protein